MYPRQSFNIRYSHLSNPVPEVSAQAHVFKLSLFSYMFFICTSAMLPSWTLCFHLGFLRGWCWVYVYAPFACRCLQKPEGKESAGTGAGNICEPSDVCGGDRTQVFCKSSMCFQLFSHLQLPLGSSQFLLYLGPIYYQVHVLYS